MLYRTRVNAPHGRALRAVQGTVVCLGVLAFSHLGCDETRGLIVDWQVISAEPPGTETGGAPETPMLDSGTGTGGTGGTGGAADGEPGAPSDLDGSTVDAGPLTTTAGLVHRYDFGGTGTVVADLVGDADGELMGGEELDGSGVLVADGDDWVDLPNGIISSLEAVTVMVWVTWDGDNSFQRIFDFGNSDVGEGRRGMGSSYFILSPFYNDRGLAAAVDLDGDGEDEVFANLGSNLPIGEVHNIVVTLIPTAIGLYLDGEHVRSTARPRPIEVDDRNNWLGRSQFAVDPGFRGSYDEVRIYDRVLTPCGIQAAFVAGPNQVELPCE